MSRQNGRASVSEQVLTRVADKLRVRGYKRGYNQDQEEFLERHLIIR